MDTSSPLPSTSSVCTLSASVAPMSPKPSKAKIVSSSLCRPSAFANAIGLPCGPFAALLVLLLLCCPLSAMPPFGHVPSDQSHLALSPSDQSHLSPSLASAAFSPSPSSVSLVLVAPSADSPSPAAPLFPPGGPANFALPTHWQNNHFPYGRTNRNQQQQQKAHATATAAGVHRQNVSPNGLPAESVPNISPLAAWGRHQQTMRAKQNQQRQQWPYSQTVPNNGQPNLRNNVGWPNSFSPIANPQQNGMELNKKSAPSSPFEGVPSFRSQYHQNRRKFTGGGLSRLVLSSEEEEQSAELEQTHPSTNWQQMAQRTTMVTPSSNHPTLNNFERYMPLLARHRPPPKNGTARWSLANSAEPSTEERIGQSAGGDRAEREQGTAEEEDEAGSDARMGGGPCVSANCRTWITITIPSELVGLGGAETNGETQHKERPPAHKAIVTQGQIVQSKPPTNGGWTKPNTPIQPPKSRGMPTARGGTAAKSGVGETTSSPQTNLPVTTRLAPPGFVFSTKWILPVNGLSVRPNGTSAAPSSISTTTPTINTTPPFTSGPRPKVSPTQPPAIPRERPSDKMRPPKPWTHTSGGKEKASNVPKSRPEQTQQPNPTEPTTDQTIEQAAIWASTELIDAIREALAKFRAALSRQGARSRKQQDGTNGEGAEGNWEGQPNYEDEEWPTQLKTAWDSLRGTWLEKAVAELAMDAASNGRTEISDGKIAELLQKAGLMDATELDRIKGTKSGE
ncbi:hypothetical protein niasHT_003085 [Heterodera trifolii]|uniref:Transmembrane protein n=1 Tax=Heterodera trifolii TaxID=157864 RepID=A0ABD2M4Z1_9BILA